MKRKALFRHISVVLLICLFFNSYIIPVSSEETIEVGQSTIVNGSFEYPYLRENDIKDKKTDTIKIHVFWDDGGQDIEVNPDEDTESIDMIEIDFKASQKK